MDEIAGMKARFMRSFHQNERVLVEAAIRSTRSPKRSAWEMLDETYIMDDSAVSRMTIPATRSS